jgi:uncharacterized membrane protein
MLSAWQGVLWYAAVAVAIAGGVVSLAAFTMRTRRRGNPDTVHKTRILYLTSYILMSVSVFLIAFRGLVQ